MTLDDKDLQPTDVMTRGEFLVELLSSIDDIVASIKRHPSGSDKEAMMLYDLHTTQKIIKGVYRVEELQDMTLYEAQIDNKPYVPKPPSLLIPDAPELLKQLLELTQKKDFDADKRTQ